MYLRYLRIIDKKSEQVEEKLHLSTRNEELIELLELQKSLTYFITSLRSNEVVLEKLLKIDSIKKYPEDTDLLEDVITENKQAIEMANVYSGILNGTMDAFASIISNNMNIVMKVLAIIYHCYEYSDYRFQCLRNERGMVPVCLLSHSSLGLFAHHNFFCGDQLLLRLLFFPRSVFSDFSKVF